VQESQTGYRPHIGMVDDILIAFRNLGAITFADESQRMSSRLSGRVTWIKTPHMVFEEMRLRQPRASHVSQIAGVRRIFHAFGAARNASLGGTRLPKA
jgi:hypothetical protein